LYSRKEVTTTKVRFFDVALADAPNKELDTNMIMAAATPWDFTVNRIIVQLDPVIPAAEVDRALTEGIVAIRVGEAAFEYYPLSECLSDIVVNVATTETAMLRITAGKGVVRGLEIEPILIPGNTKFEVYIQTVTTPALGRVTLILEGTRP